MPSTSTKRDKYAGLLLAIGHFTATDTVTTIDDFVVYGDNFETSSAIVPTDYLFSSFFLIGGLGTLAAWTIDSGTPTLVSDAVVMNPGWQMRAGHPDWDDITIQAQFTFTANSQPCLLARASDASHGIRLRTDGTSLLAENISSGVQLGSVVLSSALVDATLYWLTIACAGSTFTLNVYNDSSGTFGSSLGSLVVTDASVPAYGFIGVANATAASANVSFGGSGAAPGTVLAVTGNVPSINGVSSSATSWTAVVAQGEPAFAYSSVSPYRGGRCLSIRLAETTSGGIWASPAGPFSADSNYSWSISLRQKLLTGSTGLLTASFDNSSDSTLDMPVAADSAWHYTSGVIGGDVSSGPTQVYLGYGYRGPVQPPISQTGTIYWDDFSIGTGDGGFFIGFPVKLGIVARAYTGVRSAADTLAAATESVSRLYKGLRSAADTLTSAVDSLLRNAGKFVKEDSYKNVVLADTPSGYWRLDDPALVTAVDSSGNGLNGVYGTNTDAQSIVSTPGALSGDSDPAILFGAKTTSYVNSCGSVPSTDFTTGSLELWFKTTDASNNYHCLAEVEGRYSLFVKNGWLITYDWNFPGDRDPNWHSVADGNWHHAVMAFKSASSSAEIYLDGVKGTSLAWNPGNNLGSPFEIAANTRVGVQFFPGSIDEVALYNYALTQAQVATHYNASKMGAATDIVSRLFAGLRTIADTLTAATSAVTRVYVGARSVSDTLTAATDAVVRALAGSRAITDSLSAASDVVTRLYQGARNLTDTLAASDSVVRLGLFARVPADTLSAATDAVVRSWGTFKSVVESLSISDSVVATTIQQYIRAVADTLTAAVDAVKKTYGFKLSASVTPTSTLGKLTRKLITPTLNLLGSLGALLPTFAQGVQTLKAGPRVLALILKRAFTIKAGGDKQ